MIESNPYATAPDHGPDARGAGGGASGSYAQDGTPFGMCIKRNCSMSPRAVLLVVLLTALVCFGVGALFAWRGLWFVLPFSGLEVLALAAAFYVCGLHAGDYERYWLEPGYLMVEVRDASRVSRHRFQAGWARVILQQGVRDTKLALSIGGKELVVGRHVPAEARTLLARELTRALRSAAGMA